MSRFGSKDRDWQPMTFEQLKTLVSQFAAGLCVNEDADLVLQAFQNATKNFETVTIIASGYRELAEDIKVELKK